jgi:hypothetical protein
MQNESLVAEYLDSLSCALSFDPKLSRRVRDEVADHLHESIASATSHVDTVREIRDAARGAIGRFGSPWEIARQYAATSLGRQAKAAGFAVFFSVLCIFGTMKYRTAWYRAAHWVNGSHYAALMSVIVPIDRYAFLVALLLGFAGLFYSRILPPLGGFDPPCRKMLRRRAAVCAAATSAFIASVASDAALTAAHLAAHAWSVSIVAPIGSVLVEVGLAVYLSLCMRRLFGRFSAAAALINAQD